METSTSDTFSLQSSRDTTLLQAGTYRTYPRHTTQQILAMNRMREKKKLLDQRTRFTLFLKILLKRLESSGEKDLVQQAKLIVSICNRRHKIGDPKFESLVESMESALRSLVGEQHWIRCHAYMRYYIMKQQKQQEEEKAKREYP